MITIREILQNLGYRVNLQGNNFRCTPLYRQSSSQTVLSIDAKTGRFFDFARGKGGSLEELVKLTLNFEDVKQAENWLANKDFQLDQSAPKPMLKMPKVFDPKDFFTLPNNFFIEKGISQETLDCYQGRGAAQAGSMRHRYVFLILEESGSVIGVAGRLVTGDIPDQSGRIGKWKLIGRKSNWVYPYYFNHLEIAEKQEVILVESIGDMLALHESGFKNCLVLFGTEISPALIGKLIEINPRRIILGTNNDEENNSVGNRAADKIYSKLSKVFDKNKLYRGMPTECKDYMELFQKDGKAGIMDWYKGLFLD